MSIINTLLLGLLLTIVVVFGFGDNNNNNNNNKYGSSSSSRLIKLGEKLNLFNIRFNLNKDGM